MTRIRLATLIFMLGLWGLLIYGASTLRHLPDATEHSVCGPWGCGPPTGALLAVHMVWLAVLLPPAVALPALLQTSTCTLRSTGIALMVIGLCGILWIIGWQWFVWLPEAGPNGFEYIWERCGFAIVTAVDMPLIQMFAAGLVLRVKRSGMVMASAIGLSWLGVGQILAQQVQQPSAISQSAKLEVDEFDPFLVEFDAIFPREMKSWRARSEYFVRGLAEGEKLRLRLLEKNGDGDAIYARVSETVVAFQRKATVTLKTRKSISNFDVSRQRLFDQLDGRQQLRSDCFAAIDGRWFGCWGDSEVNHDWQRSEVFSTPKQFDGSTMQVRATQYAWIGNGFGWNYLASHPKHLATTDASQTSLILGMVYYFDGVDFETIRGEKAHVGFFDGPTRLVWITEREVFLEEVLPSANTRNSSYVITAIYHDLFSETPSVSQRGTQAIYTRDPQHRPAFFEFEW